MGTLEVKSANRKLICGVDIGGTKLSAALFTTAGDLVAKDIIYSHSDEDGDGLVKVMAELLKGLFDKNDIQPSDVLGIGVALAGHIHFKKGLLITTSNFSQPIRNYPLVEKLSVHFPGIRIVLDNDANAQAYGEYKFGAGRGYESLVFVTVSTGIGGGIIMDGKLIRGRSGTAGEIGHVITDYDSDIQCTCGNYGCAMAMASGLFFPNLYRYHLRKGARSTIGITEENAGQMNGHTIEEGLAQGDPICTKIIDTSAKVVGVTLFNIFSILNPELVILGGGLMALGEDYQNNIRAEFMSHTHAMMMEEMEIKLAETGKDAGLLGAASLILE